MAATYDLALVTPERRHLVTKASFMVLRSRAGDLGILPGHTPLIAPLVPTPVDIRTETGRKWVFVSGGFLEVRPERVTVLARTAEDAEKIDVARAERAKARAEERIASPAEGVDITRAKAALARAEGRLKTVMEAKEA